MDQSTHEVRLAQWKEIIEQCQSRPNGMTAKEWLVKNQINEKTYYYWLRKIRKLVLSEINENVLAVPSKHQEITFVEMPFQQKPESSPVCYHGAADLPYIHQPDVMIRTAKFEIGLYNTASDSLISRILQEIQNAG